MNKFLKNLERDNLYPLGRDATLSDWKSGRFVRMFAPSSWYSSMRHRMDPDADHPTGPHRVGGQGITHSSKASLHLPSWFHESYDLKWNANVCGRPLAVSEGQNFNTSWGTNGKKDVFKDDFHGVLPEGYLLIPHDFLIGSEPRWESPLSLFEYPFYAPFATLTSLFHDSGASIVDKWELEDESKGYEVRYQRELVSKINAKWWVGKAKTCRHKIEYILKWLRDPTLDLRVRWGITPSDQLKTSKERFTCTDVAELWNSYDNPEEPYALRYNLRNDYGHQRKDPDQTSGKHLDGTKSIIYGRRFELNSDRVRLRIGMMPRLKQYIVCKDTYSPALAAPCKEYKTDAVASRRETGSWDATRFRAHPNYNDAQDHLFTTPINLLGVFGEQRNSLIKDNLCYKAHTDSHYRSPKRSWFYVNTPVPDAKSEHGRVRTTLELGWTHIRSFNLCFKRVGQGLYEWKDLGWELPEESYDPPGAETNTKADNQLMAVRWLTARMNKELKGRWYLRTTGPAYTNLPIKGTNRNSTHQQIAWLGEWINMLETLMETDRRGAEYLALMMNQLIDPKRTTGWDSPRYQLNAEMKFIKGSHPGRLRKLINDPNILTPPTGLPDSERESLHKARNVFYKYLPAFTVKMFKKAKKDYLKQRHHEDCDQVLTCKCPPNGGLNISYKYLKQLYRKRCNLAVKWHISDNDCQSGKVFNALTGSLVVLLPRNRVSHKQSRDGPTILNTMNVDYSGGFIVLSNGTLDSMHVSEATGHHQRGQYPEGDSPPFAGPVRFRCTVDAVRAFRDPYVSALSSKEFKGYPATYAYDRPYCVVRKSERQSTPDWLLVRSHASVTEVRPKEEIAHDLRVHQITYDRLKLELANGVDAAGMPLSKRSRLDYVNCYLPRLENQLKFPREFNQHRVSKGFDEQLQLTNSIGQLYHDRSIGQFPVMSTAYAVLFMPVDMFDASPMEIYNWMKDYCDKLITRSLRSRRYCYANCVWQSLHKLRWWAKSFGLTRKFNRQFPMNKLENIYMKQLIRYRVKNLCPLTGRPMNRTTNVDTFREREGYVRNVKEEEIWKYQR